MHGCTTSVSLPKDEAPHSAPVEWWSFSGHLSGKDAKGRTHTYGYEYVIFQLLGLRNQEVESNGTLGINGQCMDITGANYSDGTPIEEWTCTGGANQQWIAVNGELVNPASGKCLDDPAFNTTEGTQLDLWTCNGGSNQQWSPP